MVDITNSYSWGFHKSTNINMGGPTLLVGGAITILKNMKVNGKDYPFFIMENKNCFKPPTRLGHAEWNLRVTLW